MSEICALLLTIMAIVAVCLSLHDDDPMEAIPVLDPEPDRHPLNAA